MPEIADPPSVCCFLLYSESDTEELQQLGPDLFRPRAPAHEKDQGQVVEVPRYRSRNAAKSSKRTADRRFQASRGLKSDKRPGIWFSVCSRQYPRPNFTTRPRDSEGHGRNAKASWPGLTRLRIKSGNDGLLTVVLTGGIVL